MREEDKNGKACKTNFLSQTVKMDYTHLKLIKN